MAAKKRKKLRIAQVAPLIERVPPKAYGGTERVVYTLTEELVRRGHEVTLFASGDSETSATLVAVYPRSLREAKIKNLYGLNELTLLNIGLAYKQQEEFDVIHDHNGFISLPSATIARTPVILTLHGSFTPTNRRVFATLDKPTLVAISHAQATSGRTVHVPEMVYNGLKMDHYPFSENHGDYLLFVGRISMEKGAHHAIEVAQTLDLPLIIAGKLDELDMSYFNEKVGPRLSDGRIQWIGEVNEKKRNELMSKALCLLHPVTWREPFGLTMIEAMACGCPVIAFGKGSIPEIVVEGISGYVVDDVEEMIEAVDKIDTIDKATCRRYALENFNEKMMADGYEKIYYKALKNKK